MFVELENEKLFLSLREKERVRQQCRHVAQIHFLWVEDNTCQCFTNIGETCFIQIYCGQIMSHP